MNQRGRERCNRNSIRGRRGRYLSVPPLWIVTSFILLLQIPVQAHPPPPQENDIFGAVTGCATGLVEMDDDQDGRISRGEYLDFVNLLADFLCVPPRPILDLEIQTVFYSIACLCQARPPFSEDCCLGDEAGIFTLGAADGLVRTEEQDTYLRAACLLTQAILGPQQCTIAPETLDPGAIVPIAAFVPAATTSGLTEGQLIAIIIGAVLLALLCCFLLCCFCKPGKEEEEVKEVVTKEDEVVEALPIRVDEEAALPIINELKSEPRELIPSPAPPEPKHAPEPAPAPIIVPVALLGNAPPTESSDDDSENLGRKLGANVDDDSEGSTNRRFRGQGMLPQPPAPEGVVLRHIEVEKEGPGEYEYPERELLEHKEKPPPDEAQVFEPYVPDGGVYDPKRPPKAQVVMNPRWEKSTKLTPEPFDPRKLRRQLGMGHGEVFEALSSYKEPREQSKFLRCSPAVL
jgi:hypothetical protein